MKEILDGVMLGDASLQIDKKNRCINGRFSQCCKHVDYLDFIRNAFASKELTFCPSYVLRRDKRWDSQTYTLRSRAHPYWTDECNRWYKEEQKRVPRDIEITPIVLLHWFLCDGSLGYAWEELVRVTLSSQSFPHEDVEYLRDKLSQIGIFTWNDKGRIQVQKTSIPRFFEYIPVSPVWSFHYKWVFCRPEYDFWKELSNSFQKLSFPSATKV